MLPDTIKFTLIDLFFKFVIELSLISFFEYPTFLKFHNRKDGRRIKIISKKKLSS